MLDLDRKDYQLIINSIDLTINEYIFTNYIIRGNGTRYPDNDTADINSLMNLLRFDELSNNRIIIDIVTCIISTRTPAGVSSKVLWETPGAEGKIPDSILLDKF